MTTYPSTTVSSLNGLFKNRYGDGVVDAIPRQSILQKLIPFDGSKQLGASFNFPVVLAQEGGVTFGGTAGNAFNLNAAIPMTTQNAQIVSGEVVVRGILSVGAASRALNEGPAAFESATALQMENMIESHSKVREIEMLYGASTTGLSQGSVASVNSTTVTFTPGAGQWSYLWVGTTNRNIDCYSGTTLLNTNGPVVVSKVNVVAKTLTLTAAAADITAILAATAGTVTLFWYLAYGNENLGIEAIAANTTATQFTISAATWDLWQGNTYAVGGDLSFSNVGDFLSVLQGRGLEEDIELYVSPKTWRFFNDANVSYRKLDSSYTTKVTQVGAASVEYESHTGTLSVVAHQYVKEGFAYLVCSDRFHRIGSSDITFNRPGGEEGRFFRDLENQNGFEYRTYSDFAIINERPSTCGVMTGITNV